LKTKRAPLLLAVILAAPAFAFADNIPGHSRTGNSYVTFSEGFTEQQDLQGSSARCNFLFSSVKENGSGTGSVSGAFLTGFAKGDNDSNPGTLLNTEKESDSHPVMLVGFGGDGSKSSSFGRDKGKGRGKSNGGDGDGNGNASGTGSGTPPPLTSVAEPGSQTLLLFGLAGLGMLFYRRKTLANAI
jgi:hypothetical protein